MKITKLRDIIREELQSLMEESPYLRCVARYTSKARPGHKMKYPDAMKKCEGMKQSKKFDGRRD